MKVMLLAYEAPEAIGLRRDKAKMKPYLDEWRAFGDSMRSAGVWRQGAALAEPETATILSVKDGKRTIEDGPFADTKEQIGGFCVIEVKDRDAAVQWAMKCPAAKKGRMEVRVIPDYGQED